MFDYEIDEINKDIKAHKRVKYGDTRPQKDPFDMSNSKSSLEIKEE